jgi:nitroreductase
MEYDDVVLGRRSIRGYLDKAVPKTLLKEVIEMAMRAPSSLNTQPWNFYVVAGESLVTRSAILPVCLTLASFATMAPTRVSIVSDRLELPNNCSK